MLSKVPGWHADLGHVMAELVAQMWGIGSLAKPGSCAHRLSQSEPYEPRVRKAWFPHMKTDEGMDFG